MNLPVEDLVTLTHIYLKAAQVHATMALASITAQSGNAYRDHMNKAEEYLKKVEEN